MVRKIKSYKFKFDYNMFRNDVQSFVEGLGMKAKDLDTLADVGSGMTSAILAGNRDNHKMQTWLAIANAMDVDPRTYFVLDV